MKGNVFCFGDIHLNSDVVSVFLSRTIISLQLVIINKIPGAIILKAVIIT